MRKKRTISAVPASSNLYRFVVGVHDNSHLGCEYHPYTEAMDATASGSLMLTYVHRPRDDCLSLIVDLQSHDIAYAIVLEHDKSWKDNGSMPLCIESSRNCPHRWFLPFGCSCSCSCSCFHVSKLNPISASVLI